MHQNLTAVLQQMELYGLQLRPKDEAKFPVLDKRTTCGKGGKYWYKLYEFCPRKGGRYLVGSFGGYKEGDFEKVVFETTDLDQEERERMARERAAKQAAAEEQRKLEAQRAAMSAGQLWRSASSQGESAYLVSKGVEAECCKYLPDGSILIPLLRYDLPRGQALRGLQRIYPGPRFDPETQEELPSKTYTWNFSKAGCALRLGDVQPGHIVLICEGYATGLTLRIASNRDLAVYVALDAGNLQHVVPLVRELHPESRILICADDDWRTRDPITKKLNNPGRTAAKRAAGETNDVEVVYPIFNATTRGDKDTDYNDLHARQGLGAVSRQLRTVLHGMRSIYG